MTRDWDAIVIGSGMGGLSAASLLARVADKKVLVLEKHAEPGGFTHVFRRDGASWDVGLHYVGGLEKEHLERQLFDYITGGALDWNKMTDEFERFVYPGFTFPVPSDPALYEQRLVERYPDEEKAIRTYFRNVRWASAWHIRRVREQMMPAPIAWAMAVRRYLETAKATQTIGAYMDAHFRSPELKALLTSQWGDYGVPPHKGAFALHALVVCSYLEGAFFPAGGSGRIARTIEAVIEAHGGAIRTCQEVTSIVVENGRAVGVKAIDRHCAEPKETVYRAPVVVSDAGAPITFLQLLPRDGETGRKTADIRKRIETLAGGFSAVTLYIRLTKPVSSLGVLGENYWINTGLDHDDLAANTAMTIEGEPRYGYLSFPSAKSGDDRFHTAEILTALDPEAFAPWRDTESGRRGADYEALKQRISDGLLRLAELAVPGLSDLVVYKELSTPLTIQHFTSHPMGRFFGLPGTSERYRASPLRARTPVPGLVLTGSDMSSLGVVGAMIGGLAAASNILGGTAITRIMKLLRDPDAAAMPAPAEIRPGLDIYRVTLKTKTALTPRIWRLDYAIDAPPDFAPGQYGKLRIAPFEWRCYSIAECTNGHLTLLVSNRTGGDGSLYADKVQTGEQTLFEMPLGCYRLNDNARRKVFVATGTGLAPFLPMFHALADKGQLEKAELYFGCRSQKEDITLGLADLLPKTTRCFSRAEATAPNIAGRVTEALAGLAFDPHETDFYICGAAAMVADVRAILNRAGAVHILTEPY